MFNERRQNRRSEAAASNTRPIVQPSHQPPPVPSTSQYSTNSRRTYESRDYERGGRPASFRYNDPGMRRGPDEYRGYQGSRDSREHNDYRDYRAYREPRQNQDNGRRRFNDDHPRHNKRPRYDNDRFQGGVRIRGNAAVVPLESLKPKDSKWDVCPEKFIGMSAKFAKTMGIFSASDQLLKNIDDVTIQGLIAKQNALLEAHQNWVQVEEAILGLQESNSSKTVILKGVDLDRFSPESVCKYLEGFLAAVVIPNVSYEDLSLSISVCEEVSKNVTRKVETADSAEETNSDNNGKTDKEKEVGTVNNGGHDVDAGDGSEGTSVDDSTSASSNRKVDGSTETDDSTKREDVAISRYMVVECITSLVATTLMSLNNKNVKEFDCVVNITRPNSYIANAKPLKQAIKSNENEKNSEENHSENIMEEIVESAFLIATNVLPEETSTEEIRDKLSKYGKLHSLTTLIDKLTYECNGTAFFTFQDFSAELSSTQEVVDAINKDLNWKCFLPCINTKNGYNQKVTITKYNLREYVDMKNEDVSRHRVSCTIQLLNSISAEDLSNDFKYKQVSGAFEESVRELKGYQDFVLVRPSPGDKINTEELHPEYGKIFVKFQSPNDAKSCLNAICGRYFSGRLIMGGYVDDADHEKYFEKLQQ
jgi:hypothetical protein